MLLPIITLWMASKEGPNKHLPLKRNCLIYSKPAYGPQNSLHKDRLNTQFVELPNGTFQASTKKLQAFVCTSSYCLITESSGSGFLDQSIHFSYTKCLADSVCSHCQLQSCICQEKNALKGASKPPCLHLENSSFWRTPPP